MKKSFVFVLLSVLLISLFITGMASADGGQWWQYPNSGEPHSWNNNSWNNNSWNNNCWNGNNWGGNCWNQCYGNSCNPLPSLCATFISDVSIPDGMYVAPGSSFTKTWRIKNSGSITWNSGYQLVFSSGNQMSGPASVSLPYSVAPGQTIDISVNLVAPNYGGTFRGNWMIRSDTGQLFGVGTSCKVAMWVEISTQTQYYNNCSCNNCNCYQPCYGYSCNPAPQQPQQPPQHQQPDPWPWNPWPQWPQ
ncbi:MAG: NBR1-Ig-like domain-containing protein [Flexilinea sp.]